MLILLIMLPYLLMISFVSVIYAFEPSCQDIKEEWMKFCFHTRNKKHKTFIYYKGSQKCNELFNDYYECFINDKIERK